MAEKRDCEANWESAVSGDPPPTLPTPGRWKRALGIGVGVFGPVLLPFIHLGFINRLWDKYTRDVDRRTCSCSCWDTAFKGSYETGVASYKHIYFNSTWNTGKIWTITVLAIICVYECLSRIVSLVLTSHLRITMCVIVVVQIYPHYYSWWAYFNYWNDEFYSQWYHQLYFTITESASTIAALYFLDDRLRPTVNALLLIIGTSIAHVLVSSSDQAVENIVRGEGSLHQVMRDVGFFLPDLVQLVMGIKEFQNLGRFHRVNCLYLISNRQFFMVLTFVFLSWITCISV